jgi:hypothetical protein
VQGGVGAGSRRRGPEREKTAHGAEPRAANEDKVDEDKVNKDRTNEDEGSDNG